MVHILPFNIIYTLCLNLYIIVELIFMIDYILLLLLFYFI